MIAGRAVQPTTALLGDVGRSKVDLLLGVLPGGFAVVAPGPLRSHGSSL